MCLINSSKKNNGYNKVQIWTLLKKEPRKCTGQPGETMGKYK